jgi:uncharacterized protein (TIGR00375 family)
MNKLIRADLHVHVGATAAGQMVKISASPDLTLHGIKAAAAWKGLQVVGVVDCHVPALQEELAGLAANGELTVPGGGGFRWRDGTLFLPAVEVETREGPQGRPMHSLVFLPDLTALQAFTDWLRTRVSNIHLSSQYCRAALAEVWQTSLFWGGFLIPAHIFTPHRGMYAAVNGLRQLLDADAPAGVPAVELGLSADSELADGLPELANLTFVSNSDAHSPLSMGREYNLIRLEDVSFAGVREALQKGGVLANFGLDPRLGKYYRSYCRHCQRLLTGSPPQLHCLCGRDDKLVVGVLDRIATLAKGSASTGRPPYYHRVPLPMVPGIGAATLKKMVMAFGSELAAAEADYEQLARVVGERLAEVICLARSGQGRFVSGGGGQYGRLLQG